jgi:hypothetical protein
VDVAGGDRGDAEVAGELAEGGVPRGVAALVRSLELDVEAVSSERRRDPRGGVRVDDPEAVARAAGQTDEPFPVRKERVQRQGRRERVGAFLRPGPGVRLGQQAAQVGVPLGRLDEQREVSAAGEADLGAGDRPDAERLRRLGELERAADSVVVGECQRVVAEVGGTGGELLGLRGPVEERVR